jgi:CYTH domain-containing protein
MQNINDKVQDIELELTYLAGSLPNEIRNVQPIKMLDIYIPENEIEHPHLRIRQRGDKYEITKKTPLVIGDASRQLELTIQLNQVEFETLVKASNRRIVKNRYQIQINGFDAEVDIFQDKLQGLVLIDFEFESERDKNNFIKPEIALADVTQEDFIAGGLLAGKSYSDIEKELARFNYKKLLCNDFL